MIQQHFLGRRLRLGITVAAVGVAGCVGDPDTTDDFARPATQAGMGGAVAPSGGSSSGGAGPAGAGTGASISQGAVGGTSSAGNGGQGNSGNASGGAGGQGGASSLGGSGGSLGRGGAGGVGGAGGSGGRGGSGGMGSAAGSGGATGNYRPCPTDGSPCKILPLGDSITWGIQYDGAYRVELFTKAVADNHKITFVGSVSNGPTMVAGQAFPKSNEGHSGWTIDQIAGLVPSPALKVVPDIILLMIGTNDVYAASGQSAMPMRLGALLDKLLAAAPQALLVVAKITPLSSASWNATIKTYNDAIPGLVEARASAGKHIMLADMNTGFTTTMLSSDSVHPNKSGYDFMGDAWYAKISALLP